MIKCIFSTFIVISGTNCIKYLIEVATVAVLINALRYQTVILNNYS